MVAGSLALPVPVRIFAQQSARAARVAIISTGSPEVEAQGKYVEAFVAKMRELGWQEGKNIVYVRRFALGDHGKLAAFADEMIALRPNAILATTTYVAQNLKPKTSTIPIVLATSLDPVGQGLVASLSRPGGNITGMSIVGEAFHAKLVELAASLLPKARRIAVMANPERKREKDYMESSLEAGKARGLEVVPVFARNRKEIDQAFAAFARERPDVLVIVPDTLFVTFRSAILKEAARARLPVVGPIAEFAEDGALASYGTSIPTMYGRSAYFVDKILRGANPGDLPIEQAATFDLVLNMRTAQLLGVEIPQAVLLRADRRID